MMENLCFTTREGFSLRGQAEGDPAAPPVILLHGGGQTRRSWARTSSMLARQGYYAVSYDARGHGDSDWSPDGDYGLPSLARDLELVRASLDRPPALVGASMGGVTGFFSVGSGAADFASSLVMVDIVLRPNPAGEKRIREFMQGHMDGFATLEEAAEAVARYNPSRPRPADPSGLMHNLRRKPDGRLYWHWDPELVREDPSSEPPAFASQLLGVASGVRIPTLLVRGSESDIVDDDGVAEMQRHVHHLEIADVTGAGHMVANDRNDIFSGKILPFLMRTLPCSDGA